MNFGYSEFYNDTNVSLVFSVENISSHNNWRRYEITVSGTKYWTAKSSGNAGDTVFLDSGSSTTYNMNYGSTISGLSIIYGPCSSDSSHNFTGTTYTISCPQLGPFNLNLVSGTSGTMLLDGFAKNSLEAKFNFSNPLDEQNRIIKLWYSTTEIGSIPSGIFPTGNVTYTADGFELNPEVWINGLSSNTLYYVHGRMRVTGSKNVYAYPSISAALSGRTLREPDTYTLFTTVTDTSVTITCRTGRTSDVLRKITFDNDPNKILYINAYNTTATETFNGLTPNTNYSWNWEARESTEVEVVTGTITFKTATPTPLAVSIKYSTSYSGMTIEITPSSHSYSFNWNLTIGSGISESGSVPAYVTSSIIRTYSTLQPSLKYRVNFTATSGGYEVANKSQYLIMTGNFSWTTQKKSEDENYNKIYASEWNDFCTALADKVNHKTGIRPTFPSAVQGQRLYANYDSSQPTLVAMNPIIKSLNDNFGENISSVNKDDSISAALLNNLVTCLNKIYWWDI